MQIEFRAIRDLVCQVCGKYQFSAALIDEFSAQLHWRLQYARDVADTEKAVIECVDALPGRFKAAEEKNALIEAFSRAGLLTSWRKCGSERDVALFEGHDPITAAMLDSLEALVHYKQFASDNKVICISRLLDRGVELGLIKYMERSAAIRSLSSQYGWM